MPKIWTEIDGNIYVAYMYSNSRDVILFCRMTERTSDDVGEDFEVNINSVNNTATISLNGNIVSLLYPSTTESLTYQYISPGILEFANTIPLTYSIAIKGSNRMWRDNAYRFNYGPTLPPINNGPLLGANIQGMTPGATPVIRNGDAVLRAAENRVIAAQTNDCNDKSDGFSSTILYIGLPFAILIGILFGAFFFSSDDTK